ncbi:hypothetical protein K0M31_018152 [Melipona bicolor]|uniref:Uncharacterized protein n=1 Tax=Melipona bicolor TaxID=60889 RepID=A0AA40FD21_9HYME|nr:hypothetical protein K0M31_018152 [Melipona bicolor]
MLAPQQKSSSPAGTVSTSTLTLSLMNSSRFPETAQLAACKVASLREQFCPIWSLSEQLFGEVLCKLLANCSQCGRGITVENASRSNFPADILLRWPLGRQIEESDDVLSVEDNGR